MAAEDTTGERPGLAEAPAYLDFAGNELPSPVILLDRHRRPASPAGDDPPPSERGEERPIRVLVVEDEEDDFLVVRDLLARAEGARFHLDRVGDAETALARLARGQHDVCLCDHRLPGGDGLDLARQAARRGIATPVVLVSGLAEPGLDLDAIAAGAADYLDKEQYEVEGLERALRLALARARRSAAPVPAAALTAGRDLFRDRVRRALARARRRGSTGAVLLLAVARVEALERQHGKEAVDALLLEVAERLPVALREADTLLELGRNLFGVVLEDLQRPEHAALVARKLVERVAGLPRSAGLEATAGVGLAVVVGGGAEAAALEAAAEAALGRALADGGGRCCQDDHAAEVAVDAALDLARELGRAIRADALSLDFQPQVTLRSAELALAAVVRWRHPAAGTLEGERLRGLAEVGGLAEALDDWVIAAACRQARRWHDAGFAPAHVAVPLLSRRRLGWSDLKRRLEGHLAEARLAPRWLELELDEQLVLEDLEGGHEGAALREASALGVRLAVAGFGSGPTSLAVLRDAPLATVKLSRTLLQGAPGDEARARLAAGVIGIARDLSLRLVAEGVESQSQLQLLRAHGCDAVQSYVSCPPLPAEACTDWLRQASRRA